MMTSAEEFSLIFLSPLPLPLPTPTIPSGAIYPMTPEQEVLARSGIIMEANLGFDVVEVIEIGENC